MCTMSKLLWSQLLLYPERIIFGVINTRIPEESSYIHLKEKDSNTEVT